jgi:hypothetical protein
LQLSKETSNMPTLADMLRARLHQGDAQGWSDPNDEQGCLVCLIAELAQQQNDGTNVDHAPELRWLRARLAKLEVKRPPF